jgi:hypothetical protein
MMKKTYLMPCINDYELLEESLLAGSTGGPGPAVGDDLPQVNPGNNARPCNVWAEDEAFENEDEQN